MEIILNELRHAGLVESKRGSEGGYRLARAAEKISVAEVIECIEGPISLAADAEKDSGNTGFLGNEAFDIRHFIISFNF